MLKFDYVCQKMLMAIVSTHNNDEYDIANRFLFKVSKWYVGGGRFSSFMVSVF
jgi:hypothetical protein